MGGNFCGQGNELYKEMQEVSNFNREKMRRIFDTHDILIYFEKSWICHSVYLWMPDWNIVLPCLASFPKLLKAVFSQLIILLSKIVGLKHTILISSIVSWQITVLEWKSTIIIIKKALQILTKLLKVTKFKKEPKSSTLWPNKRLITIFYKNLLKTRKSLVSYSYKAIAIQ